MEGDEFDPSAFPFPVVTVETATALAERESLARDGVAVILGDDEGAMRVASDLGIRERAPQEILAAAAVMRFPEDWASERARRNEAAKAFLEAHPRAMPRVMLNLISEGDGIREAIPEEVAEMEARGEGGPEIGEWPTTPETMEFSAGMTYRGITPRLHIAILPTRDWTEAPAYLNFGDWNECPPPEHHIAALRHWRDSFGASLVTCGADRLELAIARRPTSTDAALALAREQYAYCNDLIDQGFGDFARLAGSLMVSNWWSFWWD
jgi:hypothetical protein